MNKQQQDKQIIENAPDGATHYEMLSNRHRERTIDDNRSLKDIRELIKLRDEINEKDMLIADLKKQLEELTFSYESLGEDYSDAQHQNALYEINWPKGKDLNKIKADAVRDAVNKTPTHRMHGDYRRVYHAEHFLLEYADKLERGE